MSCALLPTRVLRVCRYDGRLVFVDACLRVSVLVHEGQDVYTLGTPSREHPKYHNSGLEERAYRHDPPIAVDYPATDKTCV